MNQEQYEFLQHVNMGHNVFLSGSGGCGKTYMLKEIYQRHKDKKTIQMTASTGVAAQNIEGITVHKFAGYKSTMDIVQIIKYMKTEERELWKEVDVLIIDEISMLDADFFDLLHQIAQKLRGNMKVFGGIQLIVSGDFYQLPPVKGNFCFTSTVWTRCQFKNVILSQSFRQKEDLNYFHLLQRLRKAQLSEDDINLLLENHVENYTDHPLWLRCFFTRAQVQKYNEEKLNEIKGNVIEYHNTTTNKVYEKEFAIPEMIKVKEKANIMLIKNIDVSLNLVNGTRGTFQLSHDGNPLFIREDSFVYPLKKYEEEIRLKNKVVSKRSGYPIVLAFALTVHKCQGLTCYGLYIKLDDKEFSSGLIYVGLSRVCNLKQLKLFGKKDTIRKNLQAIKVRFEVQQFYDAIEKQNISLKRKYTEVE